VNIAHERSRGPERRNTSPDLHLSHSLRRQLEKLPKSQRGSFSRASQISEMEGAINILSPLRTKTRFSFGDIQSPLDEDTNIKNLGKVNITSFAPNNDRHGFLTPQGNKRRMSNHRSNPFLSPRDDHRRVSGMSNASAINSKLFSPSKNLSKCSTASPSKFRDSRFGLDLKSAHHASWRNSQDDVKESFKDRISSPTRTNTLNVAHAHTIHNNRTARKSLDIKEIIIASRFRLIKKLGKGSFGVAYESVDLLTNNHCAIKLERKKDNRNLNVNKREIAILEQLSSCNRVPSLIWHGMYKQYSVMAMELQGMNLSDLYELCGRQFSLKTGIYILIECLKCIQEVHSMGIVHRDIKPQNFILDHNPLSNKVHVIDFGLSSWYLNAMDEHIPHSRCSPVGTARYASINNHAGVHQTRRDDLESIGYMVIFFLKGELPWQGIREAKRVKKWKKIQNKKESVSNSTLTQNLPLEFCHYLETVKRLRFEEEPNYEKLIKVFKKLYVARGYYQEDIIERASRRTSKVSSEDAQNSDSLMDSTTLSEDPMEAAARGDFEIANVVVPDWQELQG